MTKRILALMLALILTFGAFSVSAEAASYTQVYQFFADFARNGTHDAAAGSWSNSTWINQENKIAYQVLLSEQNREIELSIKMGGSMKVALIVPAQEPASTFRAYIEGYNAEGFIGKGSVNVSKSYNAEPFADFAAYQGQTENNMRQALCSYLNAILPELLQITRAFLYDSSNQFSLSDMGLINFKYCTNHRYGAGVVTQEPNCVESGYITYTCVYCGTRYSDLLSPNNSHAWELREVLTETTDSAHGTAKYRCKRCGASKTGRLCAAEIFTDMPGDESWAHKPIDWAFFSGITKGKTDTTFAPKAKITRGEAMFFLWTLAGKPNPTSTESPFEDVQPGKFYFKPVLWAVENGITGGKTATHFGPKDPCSRAQITTFLWIAAGRPEPGLANPFQDVQQGKYYYKAVLWAVENGVTSGIGEGLFSPYTLCARDQVVTFLYKVRDILNPAEP